MFGRRKELPKITGDTPIHSSTFWGKPTSRNRPAKEVMSQREIDAWNEAREVVGEDVIFIPSALSFGPEIDYSDPQTQKLLAGLDETIKSAIERRAGKTALQEATDENGNLLY